MVATFTPQQAPKDLDLHDELNQVLCQLRRTLWQAIGLWRSIAPRQVGRHVGHIAEIMLTTPDRLRHTVLMSLWRDQSVSRLLDIYSALDLVVEVGNMHLEISMEEMAVLEQHMRSLAISPEGQSLAQQVAMAHEILRREARFVHEMVRSVEMQKRSLRRAVVA